LWRTALFPHKADNNEDIVMADFSKVIAGVIILAAAGCSTPAVLNTSADAERSYDGLYPFEHTVVDRAWARADIDLSGYTKIKLEGTGIQYRATSSAANSGLAAAQRSVTSFPIDAKNRERLRQTFADAFVNELKKSKYFELTEEVGPDVLIVRGGLLDVVSKVPPERSARVDIYLESAGEATLTLELLDSESNTVLLRATDRRSAERQSMPFASNSVSNWSEVKRMAQYWARLLRENLDGLATSMTLQEPVT
jgi:uncharacterized protein DUF3313